MKDDMIQQKPILTYWVQKLQNLNEPNLFITLNPPEKYLEKKDPSGILLELTASHPIMDTNALYCQRRVWSSHQGIGNLWYAGEPKWKLLFFTQLGAYLHYGFHEDGFRSGIEVARMLLKDYSIPLQPITCQFEPFHIQLAGRTTHTR